MKKAWEIDFINKDGKETLAILDDKGEVLFTINQVAKGDFSAITDIVRSAPTLHTYVSLKASNGDISAIKVLGGII